MIDRLRQTLRDLRGRLGRRAEDSYKMRDAADSGSLAESRAGGKAEGFAESADAVREAQDDADR